MDQDVSRMADERSDTDKAFEVLGAALEVLGWVILSPPAEKAVEGLVIGTPRYIKAWQEASEKKRVEIQ